MNVFADTPRAVHNKRRRGRNACGSSAAKKHCAANPYCPSCCGTLLFSSMHYNYLKDLPQEQCYLSGVAANDSKEKRHSEEFKTYDLVEMDSGLWYGVPIFTFWRNQVDKGAMPEPDMDHNYIGLYKTHDNTFQIMLTPKPKRPTPKKK